MSAPRVLSGTMTESQMMVVPLGIVVVEYVPVPICSAAGVAPVVAVVLQLLLELLNTHTCI